ncbi:MAG: efflux RND transporter periplasmic adaptor subunit [Verrucomicrobia bacterium]|nr:efflux RND transporter periplasmic adaptor subunit [Verrucomicrobiota bacterium]
MNKIGSMVAGSVLLALAAATAWLLTRPGGAAQSVSGTIETDESHVASRYGGRVEKLFVEEGDLLRSGQVIVQLEASELRAQRDYAAALLAEMEHGPRPEEIAAAKGDWESLTAQLGFARIDARRARALYEQKGISETDRDRAVSQAEALAKSAAAAKSRYDLLLAGTRPERIEQARAQLAQIQAQLREMTIVAPTNCVLEVLNVRVGDVLAPNRQVATLLLPQHYWVRVYVPETWLGYLQLGQAVTVRVDSFPGQTFPGTIEQINRAAEFTPRNVQTVEERIRQVFGIKVRLDNRSGRLRPGMSADVQFPRAPAAPQ